MPRRFHPPTKDLRSLLPCMNSSGSNNEQRMDGSTIDGHAAYTEINGHVNPQQEISEQVN
jgi:hypothetical protein